MNEPPKVRYWKDWRSWATDELEVWQVISCPQWMKQRKCNNGTIDGWIMH
jgi:hypothetical protein